jgi:peroxiredoxin
MSKHLTNGLWIMLLIMMGTNVVLIKQNLQMRQALAKYQPQHLEIGDRMPSFTATGLNGEPISVSYTGKGPKRVLLFFTATCQFCQQQAPYWRELLTRADGAHFEVIGLVDQKEDKTKLQDYLSKVNRAPEAGTPLPVAFISTDVRRSYKLSETPITLVVANDGTVEKVWVGRWTDADMATASALLGVNLSVH